MMSYFFAKLTFQSHEVVTPDDVRLEAVSPTGRVIRMNGDGMYHAQFGPEEIGLYLKEFVCHTHAPINRYNEETGNQFFDKYDFQITGSVSE